MSSKTKETIKSFSFALIMCLVCSSLLTSAAVGLKSRQQANQLADKQKNILQALDLIDSNQKYSVDTIKSVFDKSVKEVFISKTGQILNSKSDDSMQLYVVGDNIDKYAIPFKAYGLWSWVKGYIAFDGDGKTVIGFTVYEHAETPGLGGECEKPWFKNQFKNKSIVNADGEFVSVGIAKGKIVDYVEPDQYVNNVDGMSGATITSKGIEKYLKEILASYEPFARNLRKKS